MATPVKSVSGSESQTTPTTSSPTSQASSGEQQSSGGSSEEFSKEEAKKEQILETLKSKPKNSFKAHSTDFLSASEKANSELAKDPGSAAKIVLGGISANSLQKAAKPSLSPTQSRMVMTQVVDQIQKVNPPRITSIRMTLRPDSLGELRFEVRQERDGLRVLFEADSRGVKEVLDRNITSLKEAFRAQGLDLNKVEVEVREEGSEDRQAKHRQDQEGRRRRSRNQKDFSMEEEGEQPPMDDLEEHQINQYV